MGLSTDTMPRTRVTGDAAQKEMGTLGTPRCWCQGVNTADTPTWAGCFGEHLKHLETAKENSSFTDVTSLQR